MSSPVAKKPGDVRQRASTRIRKSNRPALDGSRYAPGDVVAGKYELVRPCGQGAMGSVWVAYNRVLDVQVAIKFIAFDHAQPSDISGQRLLDEARAAARLGHPSIIRIHDFGLTTHGDPFMAMELLAGEDLADRLGREPSLPATEAVQLLLPIAHALAVAHERGIVHRDVKPENIYLADDDGAIVPKLLDFGIAQAVDRPHRLTLDGTLLGTPDYMSPEQARGRGIGPASDVWGFCVVLYEVVTGVCPFVGNDYQALLKAVLEQEPPSLERHGVDEPGLWAILERGLHKDVEQRYGSMRQLGEALALWLLERGVSEDVTGTSLRRTFLRDLEPSGPLDVSRVAPALVPPGSQPGGQGADSGSLSVAGRLGSDADLAAIAELNRGGDPVELIERAARRRTLALVIVIGAVTLALTAGILFGTGIIG